MEYFDKGLQNDLNRDVFDTWRPNICVFCIITISLLFAPISLLYYLLIFLVILMIGSITLFYSFKLPPPSSRFNDKNFCRSIIGHRGCVNLDDIDQNTTAAFKYAYNSGANGIECDIRLTKDGHPIIVHDYHIKKITNNKEQSKSPSTKFHELSLNEIKKLKLKENQSQIATLSELVDFMNKHKYKKNKKNDYEFFMLLLEIKFCHHGYTDKDLQKIMLILNKISFKNERVIFISFSMKIIYRLKKKYNDINIGLLIERHMIYNWIYKDVQITGYTAKLLYQFIDPIHTFLSQFVVPYFCGCICIGVNHFLLSEFTTYHYRKNGIYIFCWGAKSITDIRWLLSKGICCVVNNPNYAIKGINNEL